LASLRHPCKFQRVSRLGSVTAATSLTGGQPNFARCLAVTWAGRLYIHFRRLLPRNGILPRAKFTLRPPSLALSYWQRYCTALEQWARVKLCGVEHRAPHIFGRATITLGIDPHSSFFILRRCCVYAVSIIHSCMSFYLRIGPILLWPQRWVTDTQPPRR